MATARPHHRADYMLVPPLRAFALAALLVGMPLAWWARSVSGVEGKTLTAIFLCTSALLAARWTNLLQFKVCGPHAALGILIFAQFFFIGLALTATPKIDIEGILYYSFTILAAVCIFSMEREDCEGLAVALCWIAILTAIYCVTIFLAEIVEFGGRPGNLSSNQLGTAGVCGIVAGLLLLVRAGRHGVVSTVLYMMAIGAGSLVLLVALSRSSYIAVVAMLMAAGIGALGRRILGRNEPRDPSAKRSSQLATLMVLLAGLVFFLFATETGRQINERLTFAAEHVARGALTYLNESGTSGRHDESAGLRLKDLEYGFSDFETMPHGYKHRYIHFPFLSAFNDLGIVFGIFFFLFVFAFPVAIIAHCLLTPDVSFDRRFIALLYFVTLKALFLHGDHYAFLTYLFAAALYRFCTPELNARRLQRQPVASKRPSHA